jgi:3D (Asp-Asp-Asp) domain-containing protein
LEIFAEPASILPANYESKGTSACRRETMKCLITFLGFAAFLAQAVAAAREQPLLARVTVYWRSEGSGGCASSTGARLREGHCAVDPTKIPFGSRVVFDDACCVAVDSGPAVLSRKAARLSGRNSRERNALVIDRFFETKRKAMAWAETHPHFMTVWISPPGSASPQEGSQHTAATATREPTLRYARRRG